MAWQEDKVAAAAAALLAAVTEAAWADVEAVAAEAALACSEARLEVGFAETVVALV